MLPFLRQRLVHPLDLAVLQGGKDLSTWGGEGPRLLAFYAVYRENRVEVARATG